MLKINQYLVQRLLLYVDDLGYSPAYICKLLGIDYDEVLEQNVEFSEDQLESLWALSCEETGEDELGFHLGQKLGIESLGTLGMVLQHAKSVGEGLQTAANFAPLVTYLFTFKMDVTDEDIMLTLIPNHIYKNKYPIRIKQASLLTLSLMIKMYGILTMKKPHLLYVAMPAHVNNRRLTQFCYDADIAVHTDHYALKFASQVLSYPIINSNEYIAPHVIEAANRELINNYKEWTSKVYNFISYNSDGGVPNLEGVSQSFGLSSRSLQRRLRDEATSYQNIVAEFKMNTAKSLLNNDHNVKSASSKLGYDRVSDFYKSFKKWTGQTVQEYLGSK
jgi:AraC-like DNA-binding protein